ncbi:MAG: sodium ion-translocating decarboxylase subunit beta [Clostridia bacterium]|nr:sodium ion-translocating decarboxylase subunit beta [Clostridia bacterium]
MWAIGGLLIYLAIKKQMEPTLLLPIGFGCIIMNFPGLLTCAHEIEGEICGGAWKIMEGCCSVCGISGAEFIKYSGAAEPLHTLYNAGIANELFPLLLFIGIGAMIDFGPLLNNPKLMIFGAAAQFGIFFTLCMASLFFTDDVAASISIIGAADGPTSIVVANALLGGTPEASYIGAITVAAYSYMALVPIIQPPVIKLLTTKKERMIRMEYTQKTVSKTTKILFPIIITIIACIFAPGAGSLIGFLMFGNLIRECGVLEALSETAQKVLANLITIFLGITIAFNMTAEQFLSGSTLLILALGLIAFIVDTAGGVLFAKLYNLIMKLLHQPLINPMIGAAGISAFPMSGRIVHKMALKEDPNNFVLMHSIGVNVSGQIASVIAGALILNFFG